MSQSQLIKADSLFQNEKYTAAFEIYESIYQGGEVSSAMLSRMAFIKEGLGDYTSALYFLEKYYQMSGNKGALTKMVELAESKNLTGYDQTDSMFILHAIKTYKLQILLGLGSLILLLFIFIATSSRKKGRPYSLVVAQAILILLLAVISNDPYEKKSAITRSTQTIVMEGPSAASNAFTALTKGNKLEVVTTDPVWTLIELQGRRGYIRTNQLLIL